MHEEISFEHTAFNALKHDSRIDEAKKLLHTALSDAKAQITKIRPPQEDLKLQYQMLLEKAEKIRGTPLFFPYLGSGIGNGIFVELMDGSVKIDLISGIGPHYFGHSSDEIVDASIDAALSDTVMEGNLQQNADSLELMEFLAHAAHMDHCFLSFSGAMACENGLKVCFQKKFPAFRVIAFEHCFMGRTLAMSQVTDKPAFRQGLPTTLQVDYIPFYDHNDPKGSTEKTLHALRTHLTRHPKEYAALAIELVQGEGGFYSAPKEFFHAIIHEAKQHDVAIMIDEVQTFARTKELFAFHLFELEELADVVTIGKVSQVCATLYKKSFTPKPGLLSQTFTGSTSAIKASLAMLDYALHHNFFGKDGKIEKLSVMFTSQLAALAKKHPHLISGPFGMGSMIAFTAHGGDNKKATQFVHKLFDNGIISFVAGSSPTRVRFLLPVGAIQFDQIDLIIQIIEKTLQETAS